MNEYFETSVYEIYKKIDDEKNEIILEYQLKIKRLNKYGKCCKIIKERPKVMQDNINNFNKDVKKKTIISHYDSELPFFT